MKSKLNLGCGNDIKKDWINADVVDNEGVDITFDLNEFPYPFSDNKFDRILLDNVLEHLENPNKVISELYRISNKDATIKIVVPYFNCAGAYNDYTHKHYFNRKSILQLIEGLDYRNQKKEMFDYNIELVPTRFGMIIPPFVREKISFILGEVYSEIKVKLNVKK